MEFVAQGHIYNDVANSFLLKILDKKSALDYLLACMLRTSKEVVS